MSELAMTSMKSTSQKARETAARWIATATRLREEIERREKSGRGPRALAAAREALPSANVRAAKATKHAEELERAERHRDVKRARIAAHALSVSRASNRAMAAASVVSQRWARERKEEPKRLLKRKKHLDRRTTKDLRSASDVKERFGIKRRRQATEPVVPETFPTGPIVPYKPPSEVVVAVDRPGLEIGDYRLIPAAKSTAGYDLSVPKEWTADYVGKRMAEAHAVLRRLPMKTRPKSFGGNWPTYIHEGVELAYQAGAGTLHQNRGRQIKGTSAVEVARMNEALGWPLRYLNSSPAHAAAVNEWAIGAWLDNDEATAVSDHFTRQGLDYIAKMLKREKVIIT